MDQFKKLCYECMHDKGDRHTCPYCGSTEAPKQNFPMLPLGSLVGGRYVVGKALKQNSEGITYIAYDNREQCACTLREFLPEALAVRDPDTVTVCTRPGSSDAYDDCREAFNEMWRKLYRLRGLTSLISVTDVFAAGNTSYAVYEETETETLRDHLLSTAQGYIEWEQARILFMPVLSTLGTLNTSGVIHKGISPEAFIYTHEGRLKLTDFCIPQARLAYGTLDADIRDGYAPLECYTDDGSVGTWTDIYSFTAVLYRTLIGTTPISAPVRAQNDQMMIPAVFAEKLPPYVINALINGMQIEAADRTRNVEQLRSNLSASPRAVSASASVYKSAGALNIIPTGEVRTAPVTVAPGQTRRGDTAVIEADRPAMRGVKLVDEMEDPPASRTREYKELSDDAKSALEATEQKAKQRKLLTALLVVMILILIAGIGLIVSSLFGSGGAGNEPQTSATDTQQMTVPNFVGSIFDSISHDAYYSDFLHIIKVEASSTTVPAGQIMEQSIRVGTPVSKGTDIVLTVSTGAKSFTVPEVTGRTYEEALAVLAQQGLVCVKASKYNDGTHVPDTVAETFPLAGQPIKQGDTIQVILWTSPEEQPGESEPGSTREIPTDANGNPVIQEGTTAAPAPETTAVPESTTMG